MSDSSTQRLDVEDDDERQRRLRRLLRRINDSRSGSTTGSSNDGPGPSSSLAEASVPAPGGLAGFDFGVRETHPVEPPKELLARLEAFLPEMAASTSELARRAEEAPESVDIEHLEGSEREYIEMNLGIGLFDLQRRPSSEESSSSSSSSSASSSHSTSDDGGSDASSRPIRPLPNHARPLIVLLNDNDQADTSNPPPDLER